MEGEPEPPELRGIIPNSFLHIFEKVGAAKTGQQFLVRASYLEIYNEEVCFFFSFSILRLLFHFLAREQAIRVPFFLC